MRSLPVCGRPPKLSFAQLLKISCDTRSGCGQKLIFEDVKDLCHVSPTMAFTSLKLLLYLFGFTILGVAGSIIFLGANATAQHGAVIADIILGDTSELTGLADVNSDSELRFYAGIFAAYGLLLIHTATFLRDKMARVPYLALTIILAGAARIVSYYQMGEPHGLFQVLLFLEIGCAVIVLLLYPAARTRPFRP